MLKDVIFISDFGVPEDVLKHNIGAFQVGGAEQHDGALIYYLKELHDIDVEVFKCSEVGVKTIRPEAKYIISNFTGLSPAVKEQLQIYGNYIIYEHDHQWCVQRNPAMFPGLIVPMQAQLNIPFYAHAAAVICMTRKHQEVLTNNISVQNIANIGGTFYYQEELDFISELLSRKEKGELELKPENIAAIYGHPHPLKGLHNSVRACQDSKTPFDVLLSKPTKKEFLEELATYSKIVFLPLQPETCARIVVESLMLGLKVDTIGLVGATGEPWFFWEPRQIIEEMGQPLRERVMNVVLLGLQKIKHVDYSHT